MHTNGAKVMLHPTVNTPALTEVAAAHCAACHVLARKTNFLQGRPRQRSEHWRFYQTLTLEHVSYRNILCDKNGKPAQNISGVQCDTMFVSRKST